MFGMSRAAIMIYSGQEIGEPAIGAEGFSGDDGRTSIFDYTSMPEFQRWVNGGKYDGGGLSMEQRDLRNWYAGLLEILREPAFTDGEFFGLNHANKDNESFGRIGEETVSGHWLYAFLRQDGKSGQSFLCVANFHPENALEDVSIRIPEEALSFVGKDAAEAVAFAGRFGDTGEYRAERNTLVSQGVRIGDLPAFGASYYELK